MCGICGIWGASPPGAIEAMVAALDHRGPDDRGTYRDEVAAIGMTRLAILDLSPAGHQPMSTPDARIQIVYNGEVYNFAEERRGLESAGVTFRSTSDTEVVLRLYERYGDDFLLRLRGMFALAVYDRRGGPGCERLLLARDHLGIKPLLLARVGERLVFASEMKSLLASGLVSREIDPEGLRLLLTFGSIYQPRTILRNAEMLLPAHRLIVEGSRQRIERYWSMGLDRSAGRRVRPYDELVDELAERLEESVRLQMVSDVPVGAFLSGGVDSSLLVGMMTRVAGNRVKTFSVGFGEEGQPLDETDEAERTARYFGADHSRVLVTGADVRARIDGLARALDQPSVDGVNSYFVSQAARQRVTVAISGTGGDELFAGYPWFARMAQYEARQGRPTLLAQTKAWLRRMLGRQSRSTADVDPFLAEYAGCYHIFANEGVMRLMADDLRLAVSERPMACDLLTIDELPRARAVERTSALCLRGYTANQLLRDIDAVSMAHSLEVRVPLLDVPLLDLALSLPVEAKMGPVAGDVAPHLATYRQLGSKRILIDAGRRRNALPQDIDCQPKRGFTLPMDAWLVGPLRDVFDDTLSRAAIDRRGLLAGPAVEQVKVDFLAGRRHWTCPWLLMTVELWCRQVLDAFETRIREDNHEQQSCRAG